MSITDNLSSERVFYWFCNELIIFIVNIDTLGKCCLFERKRSWYSSCCKQKPALAWQVKPTGRESMSMLVTYWIRRGRIPVKNWVIGLCPHTRHLSLKLFWRTPVWHSKILVRCCHGLNRTTLSNCHLIGLNLDLNTICNLTSIYIHILPFSEMEVPCNAASQRPFFKRSTAWWQMILMTILQTFHSDE